MKTLQGFLFLMLMILASGASENLYAQGCVAVRPCSSGGHIYSGGKMQENGQWQIGASYRYFRSFRHFRGDEEEFERVEKGTQVVNIAHSIDFSVNHAFSSRFGLSLNLPVIYYDRSSLYEHYGNSETANPDQQRFHTGAQGIGDLRVSAYYWLFNPAKEGIKGNVSLGLGVKAPTGNANVQGDFHKLSDEGREFIQRRAVDQSIQLGDGGWGGSLEVQAYGDLFKNSSLYFNGFYLFNPRNTNNTLNRGTLVGVDPLVAYHSVADQYAARLGMNYNLMPKYGLIASLGGRLEGVPAHDLLGKSEGWRRPGYIVSVEPGLSYTSLPFQFALNVPVALYRNRIKNVSDLSDPTGQKHGDAAFADYQINFTVSYIFSKKHRKMDMFKQVEEGEGIQ